jgi:hypothetical protein
MPAPEVWGPPIWTLFHVLAENINSEHYNTIFPQLFALIKRVCAFLPCPECSQHATQFLAKLKPQDVSSKENFKNTFYLFHNMVNVRKKKPLYNYGNMDKYKYIPVTIAFNNFVKVYNTRGNMKMISESFRRQLIIKDFKAWLTNNIAFFV